MNTNSQNASGQCPVMHGAVTSASKEAKAWWPNALNLDILHQQDSKTNPLGADFNYREAVKTLDVETKTVNEQLGFLMSDVQTLQQAFALTGNEDYTLFLSPYSVKDLHEFSTGFNKYKQQVDKIQTLSVYWDSQLIIKER